MSGIDFTRTPLGKTFFERTMPRLVDCLDRIATSLDAVAKALPRAHGAPGAADADVAAVLAQIAQQHLGIATLAERKADRLDFHDLSVASIAAALGAAYEAGCATRAAVPVR